MVRLTLRWKNRTSYRRLGGEFLLLLIKEGKGARRLAEINVLDVLGVEFGEHVNDGVWSGVVVKEHWLHSDRIVGWIGDLYHLQL